MDNNIALARRMFERLDDEYHERDHRIFYDLLADDVVVHYGYCRARTPLSGEHRGKEAIRHLQEKVSPLFIVDHRLEGAPTYLAHGDRVVVLGKETYTLKKTGTTVRDREFVIVLDFRDGLIARMIMIKDLSEAMDAWFNC